MRYWSALIIIFLFLIHQPLVAEKQLDFDSVHGIDISGKIVDKCVFLIFEIDENVDVNFESRFIVIFSSKRKRNKRKGAHEKGHSPLYSLQLSLQSQPAPYPQMSHTFVDNPPTAAHLRIFAPSIHSATSHYFLILFLQVFFEFHFLPA